MSNYSELKRLAEAAAEGQRVWFALVPEGAAVNPTGSALLSGPCRQDLDRMVAYVREDAYFIAAANPAAVLALIADMKKIDGDRKACWAEFKVQGRYINQLKAEVEALRKDAERYRWLRKRVGIVQGFGNFTPYSHGVEPLTDKESEESDAAIDAAMTNS